jgi:carbamoyl-phosphate synthase large subunit
LTDRRLSILVSAVGGGGHGEQILKALLLSPNRQRYRIIVADMNARCPQLALGDQGITLPSARDPAYLDQLLAICQRFDVRAVFHGCEPELRLFSEQRDRFAALGIMLPINPAHVIETCMDKIKTCEFLDRNHFVPPKFWTVQGDEDINKIDCYPVIVKPSVGSGGSANCFIAQNPEELGHILGYLRLAAATSSFILQEYVGTPEEEYTVGVLHDLDGNFINSIAVRRQLASRLNISASVPNRSGRRELGPNLVISSGISHGYVAPFPDVTQHCEAVARALGVRGPINMQCRVDSTGVRVFEINPRFSGTTSLRAMMGYNEPDVLLRRHLLKETVEPRFPYRSGWIIRSLIETELAEESAHPEPDRA